MEKATKQEFYSKLCFSLATFLPVILVLVVFSVFLFSPISTTSYSFLLTIPIVVLSTMFLVTMTRGKKSVDENQVQENEQKEDLRSSLADFTQIDEPTQQGSESDQIQNPEHQTEGQSDSSLPSESESFEVDQNGIQEMGVFDNLASDIEEEEEEEEEDSLIEISLPSGDFHGLTEEPEEKLESKLPDFLPEYIFRQQGFRELLEEINEINEDDNLIEIDISMGSSKFQDLRLLGDKCIPGD